MDSIRQVVPISSVRLGACRFCGSFSGDTKQEDGTPGDQPRIRATRHCGGESGGTDDSRDLASRICCLLKLNLARQNVVDRTSTARRRLPIDVLDGKAVDRRVGKLEFDLALVESVTAAE